MLEGKEAPCEQAVGMSIMLLWDRVCINMQLGKILCMIAES